MTQYLLYGSAVKSNIVLLPLTYKKGVFDVFYYVTNDVKYYWYNPLTHDWEEISEQVFEDEVIKFRHLYNMRRESFSVKIFSDVETGMDMYKEVELDTERVIISE